MDDSQEYLAGYSIRDLTTLNVAQNESKLDDFQQDDDTSYQQYNNSLAYAFNFVAQLKNPFTSTNCSQSCTPIQSNICHRFRKRNAWRGNRKPSWTLTNTISQIILSWIMDMLKYEFESTWTSRGTITSRWLFGEQILLLLPTVTHRRLAIPQQASTLINNTPSSSFIPSSIYCPVITANHWGVYSSQTPTNYKRI